MEQFETIDLDTDLCDLCHQELQGQPLVHCSRCSRSNPTDSQKSRSQNKSSGPIHIDIKAHELCLERDHRIHTQSSLTSPKVKYKGTSSLSPNIFTNLTPEVPRSSTEMSPCTSYPNSPLLGRVLIDRVNKERDQNKANHCANIEGIDKGSIDSVNDAAEELQERPTPKSPFSEIETRYFWSPKQDGAPLYVMKKLKERRGQETEEEDRALRVVEELRDYDSSRYLSVTPDGSRSYFSLSPLTWRRYSGTGSLQVPGIYCTTELELAEEATSIRTDWELPEGSATLSNTTQCECRTISGECTHATTCSNTQHGEHLHEIPSIHVRRASSDTSIDKAAYDRFLSDRIGKVWHENT